MGNLINIEQKEKEKYQRVWNEIPEYGNYSPAVNFMNSILEILKIYDVHSVLDAGCGSGKAMQMLVDKGYTVKGVDITLDGLIEKSIKECCIEAALWNIPLNDPFDAVLSIDVLEHIPTQMIDETISELSRLCKNFALFQIALFKDGFGKRINDTLHLSLFSIDEWSSLLKRHFRDVRRLERLPGRVTFFCSKDREIVLDAL
jgi:SAM-dependent methyltransferase